MARKGWSGLSADYRARIERAGMTRADYEAGQSLQKARGHAATPENPRAYDPQKYQRYHQERGRLETQLEARKQALWGQSARWNGRRAKENVRANVPSVKELRWAMSASDDELMEKASEIDSSKEYAWLGYH